MATMEKDILIFCCFSESSQFQSLLDYKSPYFLSRLTFLIFPGTVHCSTISEIGKIKGRKKDPVA